MEIDLLDLVVDHQGEQNRGMSSIVIASLLPPRMQALAWPLEAWSSGFLN